jgi:hypothetical protein
VFPRVPTTLTAKSISSESGYVVLEADSFRTVYLALFFYLLHFTLLGIGSQVVGIERGGLPRVYAIAACALVVLYPACVGFRAARFPRSLLRYV